MEYDGSWKLRLPDSAINDGIDPSEWPSPILSNGKMVVLPRIDPASINTAGSLIAVGKGVQNSASVVCGNTVRAFDFGRFDLFGRRAPYPDSRRAAPDVYYSLTRAELAMDTATFSSDHDVSLGGEKIGSCSRDVYVARQYPYLAVQSVRITVDPGELRSLQDAGNSAFFHELRAPPQTGSNVRFDTSFVLTRSKNSVFMFTAEASLPSITHKSTGDATKICTASCYVWEDEYAPYFEVAGFNVDPNFPGTAFNRVNMYDGKEVADSDTGDTLREFRFHVITSTVTDLDFPHPEAEARNVLLSAVERGASSVSSSSKIHVHMRTEHTKKWDSVWTTNINVLPKTGITVAEMERLVGLRRHLRYALYNVFSCVRAGGTEPLFYPGDLGLVDLYGNVSSHGDLWFLPCLLMLKPDSVRGVMAARREALPEATRLAGTYGFKGAKFPYSELTSGIPGVGTLLGTTSFWDAVAVTRIYDTALVGVNAWNYFRVTRDKEWLRDTGYNLLRGVADFVTSAFETDFASGKYTLVNSVALDGSQGTHNSFSVNACLLALKGAIEAAHALGMGTQRTWTSVYHNVKTIFFQSAAPLIKGVIRFDDNTKTRDPVRVAEPLVVLSPLYSDVVYPQGKRVQDAVVKNLDYYRIAAEEGGSSDVPLNVALFAMMEGRRSQEDISRVADFYEEFERFIDVTAEPKWGNLGSYFESRSRIRSRYAAEDEQRRMFLLPELNDVSSSALLVLTLLQVAGGASITGGVSDNQFVYDQLRFNLARFRKMPRTWLGLKVDGLAGGKDSLLVTNELRYT